MSKSVGLASCAFNRASDATTEAMRAEVIKINEGLIAANVTFDPGNGVINGHEVPQNGIALGDCTLKRIFNNGRWDHGGWLYGGFWQKLKRELRDGIRIDGQQVVTLGFSAMYLQLLYAVKAKHPVPHDDADLYERIDREAGWPNDPELKAIVRDAVKKSVIAMLFDDSEKPRESLPKGTRPYIEKRTKWTDLVRRMKERHPAIAPWIGTDVGFELMHHESEIMIATVLRCLNQALSSSRYMTGYSLRRIARKWRVRRCRRRSRNIPVGSSRGSAEGDRQSPLDVP